MSDADTPVRKPHLVNVIAARDQIVNHKNLKTGYIAPKRSGRNGNYPAFVMYDRTGRPRAFYIHRLVAFAFVLGYRDGLIINHKDEISFHNWAKNLEWETCLVSQALQKTWDSSCNFCL